MSARFVACSSCARHVRAGDCTCPFCGGAVVPCPPPQRRLTKAVSRAALHAAGAAGAALVLGNCSSGGTIQPFYGGSCIDRGGCEYDAGPVPAMDAATDPVPSFGDAIARAQDAGDATDAATDAGEDAARD